MIPPTALWMTERACKDAPVDVFFNDERWRTERPDLEYCAGCPVAWDCVLAGVDHDGIWGGMRPEPRRRLFLGHRTGSGRARLAFRKHQKELHKQAAGRRAVQAYDANQAARKAAL